MDRGRSNSGAYAAASSTSSGPRVPALPSGAGPRSQFRCTPRGRDAVESRCRGIGAAVLLVALSCQGGYGRRVPVARFSMTAVSVRFAALCWRSGLLAVAAVAVWCSVAQAWSGPVTLSTQGAEADVPQVGIAADQSAVFAWTRGDALSSAVQVRERAPSGALDPVQHVAVGDQ